MPGCFRGSIRRRFLLSLLGRRGTSFATFQRGPVFIVRGLVVRCRLLRRCRSCRRRRCRRWGSLWRSLSLSSCGWCAVRRSLSLSSRRRWSSRRIRRLGFFSTAPQKHRRAFVVVHAARDRRHWLLRRFGLNFAGRPPRAFCHPLHAFVWILGLQRAGHRKQSQRNSGAHSFIDSVAPQRHGHRRSLVGAGIVIFAVNQDGDRNQVGFALRRQFEQAEGPRAFAGLLLSARRREGLC